MVVRGRALEGKGAVIDGVYHTVEPFFGRFMALAPDGGCFGPTKRSQVVFVKFGRDSDRKIVTFSKLVYKCQTFTSYHIRWSELSCPGYDRRLHHPRNFVRLLSLFSLVLCLISILKGIRDISLVLGIEATRDLSEEKFNGVIFHVAYLFIILMQTLLSR